jgi:hypothetical protein
MKHSRYGHILHHFQPPHTVPIASDRESNIPSTMATGSDSRKRLVVLNSPDDWDDWLDVRRAEATSGLWAIIDPNISDEEAEEFIPKPVCPTPSNINRNAQEQGDLTTHELAIFVQLKLAYHGDYRIWRYQEKEVSAMKLSVLETVSSTYFDRIADLDSLRDWFQVLAEKCRPKDSDRARAIGQRYKEAIAAPTSLKKAEHWLLNWEKVMARVERFQLPEQDYNRWTSHFIKAWDGSITQVMPLLKNEMKNSKDSYTPADAAAFIRDWVRK